MAKMLGHSPVPTKIPAGSWTLPTIPRLSLQMLHVSTDVTIPWDQASDSRQVQNPGTAKLRLPELKRGENPVSKVLVWLA